MQRTRNLKRWQTESYDYASPEEFLSETRLDSGIHAIRYNGQFLDLLVENRRADTTLVVFAGAQSPKVQFTPAFEGRGLAKDTEVNLIAVADPSLGMGDTTVAWYLGNSQTGPLKKLYSALVNHVVSSLGGSRLILFGGSGGAYAVAHLANDFPECIALLSNPRLTLERWSENPLRRYFNNCHDRESKGKLTDEDRQFLAPYGPMEISSLKTGPYNHDLLIYHNLLDPWFLKLQLFPFLDAVSNDPRLKMQFSVDDLGHGGMPANQVRRIVSILSEDVDREKAIINAGFLSKPEATESALRAFPDIAFAMQKNANTQEKLKIRIDELEQFKKRTEEEESSRVSNQELLVTLENFHESLKTDIAQLQVANDRLSKQIDSSKSDQSLIMRVSRHPISRKTARFVPYRFKRILFRKFTG